ncbi:MAG TPA: hypothetical protein VF668_05015 [Pyrinomonadaceae bacterium]
MRSPVTRTLTLAANALAAAALALAAAAPASAQRGPKPFVTAEVKSETERDARLEAAIRDADGDGRDDYANAGELWTNYYYNRVDLNGDGRPEALVYLFGAYTCGSGGCNTLVFRQTEAGDYKLVAEISLTHNPVVVSERRTNGWKDLIFMVSGGGERARHAVLRFDGRTYPNNPTTAPAAPLKAPARGKAYLAGSGYRDTGFPL